MINTKQLEALYEGASVEGRGRFCPRRGIYLITIIYFGECYGKTALMAKAYWRPTINEDFNYEFIVELQLESFKGVDDTTKQDWIEREILVENAVYDKEAKQFHVEWEMIEAEKISLKELNSLFKSGGYNFNQPGSTDPGFEDLDDYSEY